MGLGCHILGVVTWSLVRTAIGGPCVGRNCEKKGLDLKGRLTVIFVSPHTLA